MVNLINVTLVVEGKIRSYVWVVIPGFRFEN